MVRPPAPIPEVLYLTRMYKPGAKWEEARDLFPCPAHLWQGIFGEIGALTAYRWDTWAAIYAALSIRAQRNFHWYYHEASLFGMAYVLVIAPTGTRKQFGIDICESLLNLELVHKAGGVQSGQALFPLLSRKELDPSWGKGAHASRPVIIVTPEWIELVKVADMKHSILAQTLNLFWHTPTSWDLNRSDRSDIHGGTRVMAPPTLSIYGTTTPQALLQHVNDEMVSNGFLNRYLILPGSMDPWKAWPGEKQIVDPRISLIPIEKKLQALDTHQWGEGKSHIGGFDKEATRAMQEWMEADFAPLMNSSSLDRDKKARLHVYAHHIPLLYAWTRQDTQAHIEDVEISKAVISTTSRFLDFLYGEEPIPITWSEKQNASIDQRILAKVRENPGGYTKRTLFDNIFAHLGPTRAKVQERIEILQRMGDLRIKNKLLILSDHEKERNPFLLDEKE